MLTFCSNSCKPFLSTALSLLPNLVRTLTMPVLSLILLHSPLLCASLLGQEEKPPCTVLPGTAITLWPKPFVKPAAMWTLRTEKARPPSWRPPPGATKTSWSVWPSTEPTLMHPTRCFLGESIPLAEKSSSGGYRDHKTSQFVYLK